ncbi:MAG: hypothetical protein ABEK01_01720 [Candidatus Nanohaloarchaea archaeon]
MQSLHKLKRNLTDESIAYGYTLSIWGSGTFLIKHYGLLTNLRIMAYILGAVIGFGFLSVLAFDRLFDRIQNLPERQIVVGSTIHLFASFGNVLISQAMIFLLAPILPAVAVFLTVGFNATVTYNIMLLVEDSLTEHIYRLEKRMNMI